MKTRKGFVTNSSSTCYILDKRNPIVATLLETGLSETAYEDHYESVPDSYNYITWLEPSRFRRIDGMGLSRGSAWGDASAVRWHLEDIDSVYREMDQDNKNPYYHWLKSLLDELGENIVMIRVSDEEPYATPRSILELLYKNKEVILAEMEYH